MGKFLTHSCIETYSAGTKENAVVGSATIDSCNIPLADDGQSAADLHRNMQFAGQAVARALRDDTQDSFGVEHGTGDFVHCAVAADRQNTLCARGKSLFRQDAGMANIFGEGNAGKCLPLAEKYLNLNADYITFSD